LKIKLIRLLGEKGRVTIPYPIRAALKLERGDILSFAAGKDAVIVRKERLCDDCASQGVWKTAADFFVDSLDLSEIGEFVDALQRRLGRETKNAKNFGAVDR
jgi:AbrB family looped-hinge helix DNA binding protein